MNKKITFLTGTALAVIAVAGAASAADLPVKAPRMAAPIVAPLFSWTGCYVGIHGGGGAMRSDFTESFLGEGRGSGSNSWGNGGLAGGQIGCNYQTGVLVLGVEGEGYWSGMKARHEFSESFTGEGPTQTFTRAQETRNKYDYTVAGRIGVAYERAFIYGKAGWAWGKFDFNASSTAIFDGVTQFSRSTYGSDWLNGPLFGLGVEYALTNNWTVKGEYNYINYGLSPVSFSETRCFVQGCEPSTAFTSSHSAEKHIFKFGLNYLFNVGPASVVARY